VSCIRDELDSGAKFRLGQGCTLGIRHKHHNRTTMRKLTAKGRSIELVCKGNLPLHETATSRKSVVAWDYWATKGKEMFD
jgi:hypothetical protein